MQHLKCLGGFKNERMDFDWEGFKLELDETQFDWGTVYEIEVETVRLCLSTCCPWARHESNLPISYFPPQIPHEDFWLALCFAQNALF